MKGKGLKIVNVLLLVDFLVIVTTAVLHEILIPRGIYEPLHVLPGFLLVALVAIHLILNRRWIKNTYFKKEKSKQEL